MLGSRPFGMTRHWVSTFRLRASAIVNYLSKVCVNAIVTGEFGVERSGHHSTLLDGNNSSDMWPRLNPR